MDGREEPDDEGDIGVVEMEGVQTTAGDGESDEGGVSYEDGDEENEDEETDDKPPVHNADRSEFAPDDEDDTDPTALDHLGRFISSLDSSNKRKASEDVGAPERADDKRKRRRRALQEQTQTGVESEFSAQAGQCQRNMFFYLELIVLFSGASKLSLDDLLAPLDSSSSNLQSLKKSAKVLASSSSKAKTLSAPLPQRAQERLDREAAYEQTKEEIDKWSATMKRIKEVCLHPIYHYALANLANLG